MNTYLDIAKKTVVENRKPLVMGVGVYLGVCLLIGAWAGAYQSGGNITELILYIFMSTFVAQIAASLIFSDLKTKERRIATFMTPAPAFAKVLPRFIGATLGAAVVMIAGLYILELGRIVSCGIFNDVWPSVININQVLFYGNAPSETAWMVAGMIGVFLMAQCTFVLGSALAPKYAFIKTLICMWLAGAIFLTCVMSLTNMTSYSIIVTDFKPIAVTGVILLYVFSAVMLWGAYWRFKRGTVTYKLF